MAESAKRSKKYPGMTAKMARGTVHPETRRKRAAAEAKRQKASGGGFEGPEQGKRVVKNPPRGGGQRGAEDEQRGSGRRTRLEGKGIGTTKGARLSSRGGQEMPTGGGGPGPRMPKRGASPRRGGPTSGEGVRSGPANVLSAKGGPRSVHDPSRLARMHVPVTGARAPGPGGRRTGSSRVDRSAEGVRSGPPTKANRPKKPTKPRGQRSQSWR